MDCAHGQVGEDKTQLEILADASDFVAHCTRWNVMFQQLVHYKRMHGNCLVPSHFQENLRLGKWVSSQRSAYKRHSLPQDRIDKLESVQFVWSVCSNHSWEEMYLHLIQYKKLYGHCIVPQEYKAIPKLGRWVKEQRFNRATMSLEHFYKLQSIGFVWNPYDKQWDDMFCRLVAYKEKHGDCLVPRRFHKDPKLGSWVYTQRQLRRNLSDCRVERLESIGFVWRIKPYYSIKKSTGKTQRDVSRYSPPLTNKGDTKSVATRELQALQYANHLRQPRDPSVAMMNVLREYTARNT